MENTAVDNQPYVVTDIANAPEDGDTSGGWHEVKVEVTAEAVESVAELLARHAYNEGVVVEEAYRQDEDGENFVIDPTRPVVVTAYIHADARALEARTLIEQGLGYLRQIGGVQQAVWSMRAEEDWANNWKEHFPVLRLGKRFVVRPSWREYEALPDDLVIHLDPGMAFGTGLHPSTEMCMLFLEETDVTGLDVLDVGAGSGILSVAAMLQGANAVTAVEIDPVAAKSLVANVALNDMNEQITTVSSDIITAGLEGAYPVILANIIARILADIADSVVALAAPTCRIIAGGIIEEREALVVEAYGRHGFVVTGRRQAADWVSLTLDRG